MGLNGSKPDAAADFEIMIAAAQQPGKYPVTVTRSPNGPAFGVLELDPASEEFATALTLASGPEDSEKERQAFGQLLFDALFTGDILQALVASRALIKAGLAKSLRIRLWVADPDLAALPWEIMYWKSQARYLATAADLALVRYLPVPEPPPLTPTERIRILVIFSSPKGGEVDAVEKANILKVLDEHKDVAEVTLLESPTVSQIHGALLEDPPYQIVHYLGHGALNKLYVADDSGGRRGLGEEDYAILFEGRRIPLVVLNACGSGAGEPERGLFSGVAPALVRRCVLAVVGMQYDFVAVDAAQRFSETFYRALLKNNLPIDLAVSEARTRLLADLGRGKRAWSTPALYLSTQSTDVLSMLRKGETETSHLIRVVGSQVAVSAEAKAAFEKLENALTEVGGLAAEMAAAVGLRRNIQAARRVLETAGPQLDQAKDLDTSARGILVKQLQEMVNQEINGIQMTASGAYAGKATAIVEAATQLAEQVNKQNFGTAAGLRTQLTTALVDIDKTVESDSAGLLERLAKAAGAAKI